MDGHRPDDANFWSYTTCKELCGVMNSLSESNAVDFVYDRPDTHMTLTRGNEVIAQKAITVLSNYNSNFDQEDQLRCFVHILRLR